jgi:predicted ATPase
MLPAQPGPLIGRAADAEDGRARLADPDVRLLTLTGPGGTGKTRLAIAIAEASRATFGSSTWFVDLSSLRDPSLVAPAIARALGAHPEPQPSALDSIHYVLRDRTALLVLDNMEQVLDAAADLALLLQSCRGLKLLVTSREPLALR